MTINYFKKYLKYKKKYLELKGGNIDLFMVPWAIKCKDNNICDTEPDKNENIKNNIIEFILSNLLINILNNDDELKMNIKIFTRNMIINFMRDFDKTFEMVGETIFINDPKYSGIINLDDLNQLLNFIYNDNNIYNLKKYNLRELLFIPELMNNYNFKNGKLMNYYYKDHWFHGEEFSNLFFKEIQSKTRKKSEFIISNKPLSCRTNLTKKILKLVNNPLSEREEFYQNEETLKWCPGDNYWVATTDEEFSNIGGLSGSAYVFTTLIKAFSNIIDYSQTIKLYLAVILWLVSISAHSFFECLVIFPREIKRLIINEFRRYLLLMNLEKYDYILKNLINEYNEEYIFDYMEDIFRKMLEYPELPDIAIF
jgi:hypothetical protein